MPETKDQKNLLSSIKINLDAKSTFTFNTVIRRGLKPKRVQRNLKLTTGELPQQVNEFLRISQLFNET